MPYFNIYKKYFLKNSLFCLFPYVYVLEAITTCWNGEAETVCEWCGNSAETAAEEKFDSITGGGF